MSKNRSHWKPEEATRLLLVRHGETAWNHEQRFQGQTDVELSLSGRKQAELLRSRLEGEKIDAVYASDFQRAMETARLATGSRELSPIPHPGLREADFGEWEGLTFKQITAEQPEVLETWYSNLADVTPPGGESIRQLQVRILETMDTLIAGHRGESLLIVSHGGPIRAFLCWVLGMDLNECWKIRLDNCALSIVQMYPEAGIVMLLNESWHLRGMTR